MNEKRQLDWLGSTFAPANDDDWESVDAAARKS